MQELNLCKIIVEEMIKLEFKESALGFVKADAYFVKAEDKPPVLQKMMLTLMLNRIYSSGPFIVPGEIRLALGISTTPEGWSDDLKLVTLPFLKLNQDHFFA